MTVNSSNDHNNITSKTELSKLSMTGGKLMRIYSKILYYFQEYFVTGINKFVSIKLKDEINLTPICLINTY